MKNVLLISIAFLFFRLSLSNATIIYVSGDVSGTWSADTVIVTGEARVPPGQSLIISPGVEVLFSVYCKLIVDNAATLRAVGNAVDSIRFDVLPPNEHWHGIRFLSASDSSRLEYCCLMHGAATGSGEDCSGGAILCRRSNPTIQHCLIKYCYAANGGGGGIACAMFSNPSIVGNIISENSIPWGDGAGILCCANSDPVISGNIISDNLCNGDGGGIYCENCNPTISSNTISGNSAIMEFAEGGGIYCYGGNPSITGNTISGNSVPYGDGGGIFCESSRPSISGNALRGNSASFSGGGIFCVQSNSTIFRNSISQNSASYGGGIYCNFSSPNISGNTIIGNTANYGGGIYCSNSGSTLVNCILWDNTPQQMYVYLGLPQVTYSDIQGGYAGTGNINLWPAFVDTAQGDYRLQWGSPCIDSGDPNPIYNDPDGTRADMGAWYYDQSLPVRILLTPYNQPIEIPASGGSFQYAIQATNIAVDSLSVLVWCNATLPDSSTYGPVLGPVSISLASGQSLRHVRTQAVPAGAPSGMYHYNAYAIAAGDTSFDSFTFVKLGADGWDTGISGWMNTGEEFFGEVVNQNGEVHPSSFILHPCFPNPFNPTTTISFEIPIASEASLKVYDISGREIASLVTGHLSLGKHQVEWNAEGLPSGIYFVRLSLDGGQSSVQKVVLMK